MTTTARIAALFLTFLLASCGWHLRGFEADAGVSHIDSVQITADKLDYKLVEILTRRLQSSKVNVIKDAGKAQFRIILENYEFDRRVATLSGSARVSEYRLTEQVDITILNTAGEVVSPQTTLDTERVYEFDEDNIHGKYDEEQLIKKEMRETLVHRIITILQIASGAETPAADAP